LSFDLAFFLIINPSPCRGESKSVQRGLVMAACLPLAADISGYICIHFFKKFSPAAPLLPQSDARGI
jgi:hypothetical protein